MVRKQAKALEHLQLININDDWETPTDLFIKACAKFNVKPKLDVCATGSNTKCERFFIKAEDGLSKDYDEDFFMNMPYSEGYKWMEKAFGEHKHFNVDGLILTYAKTDTKWWHDFVEDKAEVHFIKGRIKFEINGVVPRTCKNKKCKKQYFEPIDICRECGGDKFTEYSAPYPSCWIIYRARKRN